MAIQNQPFYIEWDKVDPTLEHGGVPNGLAGQFVAPRLGDNKTSHNSDVVTIFDVVRDSAASLSMHPAANAEGHPIRNTVEETLRALNLMMERIIDRTQVNATSQFMFTHATPPPKVFMLRPIRYPLRNPFMDNVIFHLLGTLAEIAESNANAFHSTLDPKTSQIIIGPLYHVKRSMARDLFDVEMANEVTLTELNTVFNGIIQPGPTVTSPGDSAVNPDMDRVAEALMGADALNWYPDETNWMTFGRKITEAYTPSRIFQPEASFERSTTEDVAAHGLVPANEVPVITPG